MPGRRTLLSAGSILMLIGAGAPVEAGADIQARSQKAAQADAPATRDQSDQAADPLNRPVALALVEASLGSALEAIARRAGFTLGYNAGILPGGRTVTLHASALPARDAFARVLDETGLEPSITRRGHITLAPLPDPPAIDTDIIRDIAQQAVVTGAITDAVTGDALPGAEVRVDDSELSAVTDAEGRYTLEDVPPGTHSLVASMIGYGDARREATVTAGATVSVDFALEVSALPLDEMVVTGTMAPTAMRAVPSPVSVITAEDIALRGIVRFEEILRSIPGLGVVSDDASPRTSILYVRGATSLNQAQSTIKTYIDGVEVARPISSLNQIDPSIIERIEVIRGPQASTLHGSEALAGVLQIFTKKGYLGRQNTRVQATLSGGSIESPYEDGFTPVQRHSIAIRGGERNVSYNVGASYSYTGEWVEDELIDDLGWSPDNSVNRDLGLSAGVRYTIGRVTAEATARVHTNSAGLPLQKALAEPARDGRWNYVFATKPQGLESGLDAQTYGLSINYQHTPWWKHHIVVGHDRTFVDYRRPQPRETTPADTFLYYQSLDWTRRSIAYSTALKMTLGGHLTTTLQAGFDRSTYRQENVITQDALQLTGGLGNQSADVALGELVNHGLFVQAQAAWQDRVFLTTGFRADRSTGFGDDLGYAWSPRVGLAHVFDLGDLSVKSRVSYGSAIRPPEPDRRFGRTTPDLDVLANQQLTAEAQSGYDFGLELYLGRRFSFGVTRYDQTADDLVALVHLSDLSVVPRPAQYQNVGRIKNTGWEFEGMANFAGLTLRANYTLMESTVERLSDTYTGTDFVVGQRPLWVPRSTGSVSITRSTSLGAITAAMTHKGSWQGYRYVPYFESRLGTDPNREPFTGDLRDYVDAYDPVRRYSINASYRITKHMTALFTIDNVLNDRRPNRTDLDLVKGRQVMIGLRLGTGS